MMKEFKNIWSEQRKFNRIVIGNKHLTIEDKQRLTKEYCLSLVNECMELLNELSWKTHRQESKDIIKSNIAEEIIDIQKFLIDVADVWDISLDDFVKEFWRKTRVVEQRYKQEVQLKNAVNEKKIACLDVDGVLGMYPEAFVDFVNKLKNKKYRNLNELKMKEQKKYVELKHKYRECGIKRKMKVMPFAIELTKTLKNLGYYIVILSAREYKKYSRTFADLQYWLDKNKFEYDAIYFDEQKHIKILKEMPNTNFIIEDNRNFTQQISELGYKCFLLNNIYNQGETHKNTIRINNLREVIDYVKRR